MRRGAGLEARLVEHVPDHLQCDAAAVRGALIERGSQLGDLVALDLSRVGRFVLVGDAVDDDRTIPRQRLGELIGAELGVIDPDTARPARFGELHEVELGHVACRRGHLMRSGQSF